ncbi:TetR/AcrR family transcriptional regulator [Actinospica sp.]|jgi:AcrR family transcriptional regulator|uniref:TetR/AcrR family transcriptional regulator n=1 Tax=Actinospica sp. TaxID=1872142 RepID=UPI002BDF7760|nr:TetR/AcrR family transcriptional regulator [Actinospica sp.]HWG27779.1 TetR/AcrR family transcriptional regulator [Actinospica sp.]
MEQTSALGRPRSEPARRAVLDAALRLVRRDGYQAVTIKGIAEEAGVGRQTIYRWWNSKREVLLEAIIDLARPIAQPEPTDDPVHDLRQILRGSFRLSPVAGPIISGLMADATNDPEFLAQLQSELLARRRALIRETLERAQRAGTVGEGAELNLVTDMIWGTMWYRVLSRHAPVNEALADEVTDAVLRLLGSAGK